MKRQSIISRWLFATAALSLLAACLFWAAGSTATTNSPDVAKQDDKGTIVAKLKDYDPAIHGYGFKNYGRDHEGSSDLTIPDVIKIFGAENVCQSGSTAADCVLYEPVDEWVAEKIKTMEGGHCEGLAVTSLRFWDGLPFAGKKGPADWQSGAQKVTELQERNRVLPDPAHLA